MCDTLSDVIQMENATLRSLLDKVCSEAILQDPFQDREGRELLRECIPYVSKDTQDLLRGLVGI